MSALCRVSGCCDEPLLDGVCAQHDTRPFTFDALRGVEHAWAKRGLVFDRLRAVVSHEQRLDLMLALPVSVQESARWGSPQAPGELHIGRWEIVRALLPSPSYAEALSKEGKVLISVLLPRTRP